MKCFLEDYGAQILNAQGKDFKKINKNNNNFLYPLPFEKNDTDFSLSLLKI